MSDIKGLFEKQKGQQILANANLNKVGRSVESPDYVKANIEDKSRFIPYVDFTSASNFARYGSAEKYYEDSINYISGEYPYDGSYKEKIEWHLSSSYLDRYIFDNEYPRTTGYINFGESYGSISSKDSGYDEPTTQLEWIYFKGQNTESSLNATTNPNLSLQFSNLNIYNTASQGLSNLQLEGSGGVSVEFWLKKESFSSADESRRQVIFDVWNSGTFGEPGYGRFRVEISGSDSDILNPNFQVELLSGSAGFSSNTTSGEVPTVILSGSTLTGSSWNHFAITVVNSDNQMTGRLYTNGQIDYTHTVGTSMGLITGSMLGQIGSLITSVSGAGTGFTGVQRGDAKLSASLDEFRFWKTIRTPTQIGQNWFTQVGGGTNTDITNAITASTKYSYENPVDLGVYYKFNEGIVNTTVTAPEDITILDYAGRVTNGTWTGYSVGARSTGSAIVESSASVEEFKDPIIYTTHPSVVSLLTSKKEEGQLHDFQNNANIYHSIPSWIIAEDEDKDRQPLRDLTQIIASYFDTLHLQIKALPELKNNKYPSDGDKPYPFANRLVNSMGLTTSDIFSNATDLEFLASKGDFKRFITKLEDTKNTIYQNIYNNLIYIYKSKGTEKSFRNLIRCFGVGEELVSINLYGNDITYELRNNSDFRTIKKKYADFYNTLRFSSTVFQQTASGNSNSREYISSSITASWGGNTYEAEAIFATQLDLGSVNYIPNDFIPASIFGCHTSGTANTWPTPDAGNFQVQSVRSDLYSKDAYFRLTGTIDYQFSELTSSLFKDVYDGSKWNFAVRIKPSKYPLAPGVSGSDDSTVADTFDLSFSGYNYVLDKLVNNFTVTSSVARTNALQFLTSSKRFFLGAHRQDYESTVLQKSDAKISSLRVWQNYLDDETLRAHAQDAENFGTKYPYKSAYVSQNDHFLAQNQIIVPQMETLVLNWNFDTVTSSNASGEFVVPDVSSGSVGRSARWGWLGEINEWQYPGLGFGFPENDTGSISREYVYSAKQQLPETLQSSDMISLVDDSENQMFVRDSRPIDYSFAFEKSMNAIVSQQMINYFATIVAFNNLIGEPVNRYRQDYKDMEKLRALYFERVQNTPDFEKFVEFFKWIDASLGLMLIQLAPASARFSEKLRNVIESHILERNKYWNKFPTLEMKIGDPEAGLQGINEMLYSGKRGLAPIPITATASNCVWWLDRAERSGENITSGDATVDDQRNIYRLANDFRSGSAPLLAVSRDSVATTTTYEGNVYAIRNFTKPYRFALQEMPEIHGGSNFAKNKTVEYTHEALKFGSSEQLTIAAASVPAKDGCEDVIDPNSKFKLDAKVANSTDPEGYLSGKASIFAPFSIYSSSVQSGYAADVATNFRAKTSIDNYHDDIYGDDKGIPVQGPFTEAHVGGRQHRHVNVNTASTDTTLTRPEAWDLSMASNTLTISHRTANQPRATMIRDAYAKRPLNIANIKWGTGSAVAGNYRKDYQMIQTSGRKINNRYFVKSEGFLPAIADSGWVSGVVDYALPRYDLTGTNKFIFVERFSAPGGPEVNSLGALDINAEEYSVYNEINQRNLIVRKALQGWQTDHCGHFGIVSVSGTIEGYRQPRWQDYDTLANYHKVNRNAGRPYMWAKDFSREVEFVKLIYVDVSNYNRTFVGGSTVGTTGVQGIVESHQQIQKYGYFEVELNSVANPIEHLWYMGLTSYNITLTAAGSSYPTYYWLFDRSGGTNYLQAYEWDGSSSIAIGARIEIADGLAVGDKIRILKDGSRVVYQYKPVSSDNWTDHVESTIAANGTFHPTAMFLKPGYGFTNPRISNPQYDNWYVQHAIPQSDLQYAWINDSYDRNKDQPFGYAFHYSVPSGTTSTTASVIQFVSASDFGAQAYWGGGLIWGGTPALVPTDFANINFNIYEPITSSDNNLGYPSSIPLVSPYAADDQYINSTNLEWISPGVEPQAQTFNALMLHRNGPYGYPSWKQIRTGETPVARYQRRNNILSVMGPNRPIILPNGNGPGEKSVTYMDSKRDAYKQFIEPPVVFKYRALDTAVNNSSLNNTLKLRHSYGNNKCMFSQSPVTVLAEFGNVETPNSKSIADYLKIAEENPNNQIYDLMRSDPEVWDNLEALQYNEIVYPRGANTGLAKTRGRTQYAEVADGTLNSDGTFSASLSDGINGIDRGPLERRTFWRDSTLYRNRREGPLVEQAFQIYSVGGTLQYTSSAPQSASTTLPNSQGHKDAFATSVYGLGTTPVKFVEQEDCNSGVPRYGVYYLSGASGVAQCNPVSVNNLINYPDTGELNSADVYKIHGYMATAGNSGFWTSGSGISEATSDLTASWAAQRTYYPTASAYFNHHSILADPVSQSVVMLGKWPWRVAELSGKSPWFDSYEHYANDIRGLAKSYTIIPEFRVSQHMPYYSSINDIESFRKQNDKFLSLDGADITSSAITEKPVGLGFGFNQNFFKEYSNTDFQKYFGKFTSGRSVRSITLKCNAVKKLLPYYGFYPIHRTLQLASMFSQSLGPYIDGLNWLSGSTGSCPDICETAQTGALNMQSMLQPYFAPGIMYNTVKSGLAVSWAAYTGSAPISEIGLSNNYVLSQSSNYTIPFESILNPLEFVGIPQSASNGEGKLYLLYPSYDGFDNDSIARKFYEGDKPSKRACYVEITKQNRDRALIDPNYNLYKSAINNFFGEIPNFFLEGGKLQSFVSSYRQENISLTSGTAYYMNVECFNDPTKPMVEDYWNGNEPITDFDGTVYDTAQYEGIQPGKLYHSFNGRYFGPPMLPGKAGSDGLGSYGSKAAMRGDPAYAAYTPPYFYGRSIATIKYVADGAAFSFKNLFEKATVTYSNPDLSGTFSRITGSFLPLDRPTPCEASVMNLSSSFNLFGLFQEKERRWDEGGNLIEVVDSPSSDRNRWVIAPRMETPILDFSNQPRVINTGRGMWSGYGDLLTGDGGVQFAITEFTQGVGFNDLTQSLLQKCFDEPENKPLGRVATQKLISEAIVAIPYRPNTARSSFDAPTTNIMGRNFFSIDEDMFDSFRKQQLAGGRGKLRGWTGISSSIEKMLKLMDKYIIPPELDFLTFARNSSTEVSGWIKPFVMYMFEFNHVLDKQDLADIWQGVMPKISRIAEIANPKSQGGIDLNEFTHPTGPHEFFHGKLIPDNIRWMVFKVKKKANDNYYQVTADTRDDPDLNIKFNPFDVETPYSYNWPYDYFSLVELAQIEVGNTIVKRDVNTGVTTTAALIVNPIEGENVQTRADAKKNNQKEMSAEQQIPPGEYDGG